MEIIPAIILIVVAAIAGYVIGIVDSRLTSSLSKKVEDASAPIAEKAATEKNRSGEHTVLKVTIDATLKWYLELDDIRLEDLDSLSHKQRQRLTDVVVQIRPWLEGKPETGTSDSVPVLDFQPRIVESSSPKPISPLVHPVPPTANTAPPKIDAMRGFRSLLKGDIKTPGAIKSVSIVALIDEVLQARLLTMPHITKSVRLEEGVLGEVIVFVGSTSYAGVDSVPDIEIRSVIKAAIADWDKKR